MRDIFSPSGVIGDNICGAEVMAAFLRTLMHVGHQHLASASNRRAHEGLEDYLPIALGRVAKTLQAEPVSPGASIQHIRTKETILPACW